MEGRFQGLKNQTQLTLGRKRRGDIQGYWYAKKAVPDDTELGKSWAQSWSLPCQGILYFLGRENNLSLKYFMVIKYCFTLLKNNCTLSGFFPLCGGQAVLVQEAIAL